MKTVEELAKIRDESKKLVNLRENQGGTKIVVGMGTCGISAGARETVLALLEELAKHQLDQIVLTQSDCLGWCDQEPIVEVTLSSGEKITYGKVTPERARLIVTEQLINGNTLDDLKI